MLQKLTNNLRLPISREDVFRGESVEWERLERLGSRLITSLNRQPDMNPTLMI